MKYFLDPRSGSCRRVSAVIAHLGLEVEEVFIDLLAGGNRTDEFLTVNPNGMVPALADGPVRLWEASAIMIYLCEKAGRTELWPDGPARYDVLRWMFWAAEHFRIPAPIYFEENVIAKAMGNEPNIARLGEAEKRFDRFTPVLEAHLKGRDFVSGPAPTLADIDLAAPLSQMNRSGVPYGRYPNIVKWNARLEAAIPAWRATGDRLQTQMTAALGPAS